MVATSTIRQRLDGLSGREAADRSAFDARWRYAAGARLGRGRLGSFTHTVLVDVRARLAASQPPKRILRVTLEAASKAWLVGAKRVLDSTPLNNAVATMYTLTPIRSAIRRLPKVADPELAELLRAVLSGGDDYASLSKPQLDWDDPSAREQLIDSRARDGNACLALLDRRTRTEPVAALFATVLGQDRHILLSRKGFVRHDSRKFNS